ncbi:MAG: ABC transporter ATP-binding protein [Myxococcota bacterium]
MSEEPVRARGARIDVRDLGRRFGERQALEGVSLEVERGENFALLGANGAGKTTLIRLITGYLTPTSGQVLVDGFSPLSHPSEVHRRLGFVPESSQLYPELRVEQFLRFAGGARNLRGRALSEGIERVMQQFALEGVGRRLVGNLSKGFQRRVSLAQAFLHDPALVITDEPTGGLDPLQQSEVQEILAKLRGRRTVLLCTHDLSEARKLADRVAVLSRGRLVALGPAAEVLDCDDPNALFRGEGSAPVGQAGGTPT